MEATVNPEFQVLSLGWGVQSFAIAAMMARDVLPRVDYLIHADTQHEMAGTYDFARRWTPWLGEQGLTVVTVSGSRTDAVTRWNVDSVMIPALTVDRETAKRGQVKRQCTTEWKIRPIRRYIRAELESRGLALRPGIVESWMGISLDEWRRMRDSEVAYIVNEYPLVDLKITRAGCVAWLQEQGLEVPPKSSCTFCPYRSIASWKELKRQGGPDWEEALEVDATIRVKRPKAELFVHPYRRPLPEAVTIPEDEGAAQLELELDLEHPCDSGICMT